MSDYRKVAFITGANRGLGYETARVLGKQGIVVLLGVRDAAQGEAAAARLRSKSITAEAIRFDAADFSTHQGVYEHIALHYGKLDILINNAGVALAPLFGNNSTDVTQETLKATFEVNFFTVVALTQTLLPLIRKAPAGRIVNLSSILGSLTMHSMTDSPIGPAKEMAYNASKTALNAFTAHLADALRDTQIKVNSAHPGWVKTDMGGPQAQMEVEDGGKTSVQLATLSADGPTGGFFHLGEMLPW